MTQEQIRQLEKELWDAADSLRANSKLTAAEYKDPVLGLVMLRFAQNKYEEAKPIVQSKIPTGPRGKRAETREDYLSAGAIMLTKLKEEKLRIERWRESRQITAQVKTIIFDTLQWLPQSTYSDQDVSEKTINVYQHIYTNYPGGQFNTYTRAIA